MLLWAAYESGIPHNQIVASFCDTKNEAECTYEHIRMLSEKVFPIETIETIGFKAIAKKHKMFPTKTRRYCTRDLKLTPTKKFLEALTEKHKEVVCLSGVRRGESFERSKLSEWAGPMESYFHLREWRPLIDWNLKDILNIHARYGIPLNPLYSLGAQRVGCFPCIFSKKAEIRAMAMHAPERVEYLREWEEEMGNERGYQSFFSSDKIPERFRTQTYINAKGNPVKVATIDDVVKWANTGKGAVGLPCDWDLFAEQTKDLPPQICLAQHLACE